MAAAWLAISFAACTGSIGGNGNPGTGGTGEDGSGGDNSSAGNGTGGGSAGADGNPAAVSCGERTLGVQPLRRLSATQYQNTLRDLFGAPLAAPLFDGSLFPATLYNAGFENDAEANIVSTATSNSIEDHAERIAKTILANPDPTLRALTTCNLPASITDAAIDGCIDAFIRDFGLRAFRRPVAVDEAASIKGLYTAVRADQGARAAWTTAVQYFVQAPGLLYRTERGTEAAPVDGLVRVTGYEMASRLSYFLTNTMPDPELFAAAAAGRLSTPDEIRTQAARLMGKPGFWDAFGGFHRDWLRLGPLVGAVRDAARFPSFTPAVQQAMTDETGRFVRHVIEDGDGTLRSLLAGTSRPVNAALATFYGVAAPGAGGDTWVNVEIENRNGVLTAGALMAASSQGNQTSPIHRGAFFQREILCSELPSLPADIDTQGPLQNTASLPTARERLSPLLTNGQCKSCHTFINPLGLALENFDAAGQWRDQENGVRIDPSGAVDLDEVEHTFDSPGRAIELVAGAAQAQSCYGLQLYRFAVGHHEFAEDACSVAALQRAAVTSRGDIRALVLALVETDGFLFRKESQP